MRDYIELLLQLFFCCSARLVVTIHDPFTCNFPECNSRCSARVAYLFSYIHVDSRRQRGTDDLFKGGRILPLNTPCSSVLLIADDTPSSSHSFPRRVAHKEDHQAAEASSERGRPSATTASATSLRSTRATRSLFLFRGGRDDEFHSSPPFPRASSMM
jgi:hypothetical protein